MGGDLIPPFTLLKVDSPTPTCLGIASAGSLDLAAPPRCELGASESRDGLSGRVGHGPVPGHAMSQIYVSENGRLQSRMPSTAVVPAPVRDGEESAGSPQAGAGAGPTTQGREGRVSRVSKRICLGVWGSSPAPSDWLSVLPASQPKRAMVCTSGMVSRFLGCGLVACKSLTSCGLLASRPTSAPPSSVHHAGPHGPDDQWICVVLR
ncbi:hypothetical protein QBC39DRAFT_95465 [Podospora conica]|nr:hypothetical protein QBC39DRAFT_95465 [Schizothecium conicum]